MQFDELREQVDKAPLSTRATLDMLTMYVSAGPSILPQYASYLEQASSYQEFFNLIYADESLKDSMIWAEVAKLNRKDWLRFFEPKMLIANLKLKADGVPIQMESGVVLAPTGSRDNIANLYVFDNGAFNRQAAEFVTSIGGRFKVSDYEFLGIYGIYKYRGNVILEEWEAEREPVFVPEKSTERFSEPAV